MMFAPVHQQNVVPVLCGPVRNKCLADCLNAFHAVVQSLDAVVFHFPCSGPHLPLPSPSILTPPHSSPQSKLPSPPGPTEPRNLLGLKDH